MYQLKKVNLISVGVYSFILIFILALFIMIFVGSFDLMFSNFMFRGFGRRPFLLPFHFIYFFFFPFIYAFMGTIFNLIIAFIYNIISLKLGGIKFKLEKIGEINEVTEG